MKSVISRGFCANREYFYFTFEGRHYQRNNEKEILSLYKSFGG